ncbi:ATP-dependent RNA helicase RhlE [Tepidimonas alkaliphilus]|uniref:ATP-dependent RNA helicase RhlE n=1 Tax=Tepidimonas alkaliphilus TaxID=2588942 RepID=A0A554WD37_9BURK|nr:DEAD/DEAH box helicase [Tepidimonas alkaliphilus]TSE21476.1 ATP-dependent RNA helicase RhlE [Tepidimonas alkaliphilus]
MNTDSLHANSSAPASAAGFAALGLHPALLRAVAERGFETPTAVQQQAIPLALPQADGGCADLIVCSQTGSGKTAAYLLPLLHGLLQTSGAAATASIKAFGKPAESAARPSVLVLCPTRELAQQVGRDAVELLRHARFLRVATVVGGLPYRQQLQRLSGVHLLVATPGRLLDLQRSGRLRLDAVQHLVLDEADRMLDLGFADDLAAIHTLTAARRQTLMFSATMAPPVQRLAAGVMRTPRQVMLATPQQRHAHIEQRLHWCDDAQHKRRLLHHWLRDATLQQAIVFASTQVECDALADELQQAGFAAVALHGAMPQGVRQRRLQALREGRVQILVATDVAARGIDVPSISHVFNYGLPMKAEDYVHRIGRTGRAGRQGVAVTMAEPRDRRRLAAIEALRREPIPEHTVAGLEPQRTVSRQERQRAPRGRRSTLHSRSSARSSQGGGLAGHRPPKAAVRRSG